MDMNNQHIWIKCLTSINNLLEDTHNVYVDIKKYDGNQQKIKISPTWLIDKNKESVSSNFGFASTMNKMYRTLDLFNLRVKGYNLGQQELLEITKDNINKYSEEAIKYSTYIMAENLNQITIDNIGHDDIKTLEKIISQIRIHIDFICKERDVYIKGVKLDDKSGFTKRLAHEVALKRKGDRIGCLVFLCDHIQIDLKLIQLKVVKEIPKLFDKDFGDTVREYIQLLDSYLATSKATPLPGYVPIKEIKKWQHLKERLDRIDNDKDGKEPPLTQDELSQIPNYRTFLDKTYTVTLHHSINSYKNIKVNLSMIISKLETIICFKMSDLNYLFKTKPFFDFVDTLIDCRDQIVTSICLLKDVHLRKIQVRSSHYKNVNPDSHNNVSKPLSRTSCNWYTEELMTLIGNHLSQINNHDRVVQLKRKMEEYRFLIENLSTFEGESTLRSDNNSTVSKTQSISQLKKKEDIFQRLSMLKLYINREQSQIVSCIKKYGQIYINNMEMTHPKIEKYIYPLLYDPNDISYYSNK